MSFIGPSEGTIERRAFAMVSAVRRDEGEGPCGATPPLESLASLPRNRLGRQFAPTAEPAFTRPLP